MFDSLANKTFRFHSVVFLSAFILASCGGGGSDTSGKTETDTTPPTIMLIGESNITLELNDTYDEPGATATDNIDGDVSVEITGSIDTSTPDTYTITYTAKDTASNTSTVTRTIIIVNPVNTIPDPESFITTWKTDNAGVSNNNQIRIGTSGTTNTYDYSVDWGDSQTDSNVTGNKTHTYATAGTYTVKISGLFPQILSGANSDASKLLTVEQWGNIEWISMNSAFQNCENLAINATDAPNLFNVSNLSFMFDGASTFNQDISHWKVAFSTDMSFMFRNAAAFNQDLNTWKVFSVTSMNSMFSGALAFNQDLSNWNVISVTNMNKMFFGASAFNGDISTWNVENVTYMGYMFYNNTVFNQDISAWDVSAVTDMRFLFAFASAFNQDISQWLVTASSATNMNGMFYNASVFNQNIGGWDVGLVTYMGSVFSGASAFNQDISLWNVASVTDMSGMFQNASAFNQNIGGWSVSGVTTMKRMFNGASTFNQDLTNWLISSVTDISFMFDGATAFNQNIGAWNVASVTKMASMFDGVTLSTANYDALLTGWSARTLQNGVIFSAGNSLYSITTQANRDTLTSFGWTITDGGIAP